MQLRAVFTDRVMRFSLETDETSGRAFVGIPVRNTMVEYIEWYEVDAATFARFVADPTQAHELVGKARRREVDHLLLFKPGRDRGAPD